MTIVYDDTLPGNPRILWNVWNGAGFGASLEHKKEKEELKKEKRRLQRACMPSEGG